MNCIFFSCCFSASIYVSESISVAKCRPGHVNYIVLYLKENRTFSEAKSSRSKQMHYSYSKHDKIIIHTKKTKICIKKPWRKGQEIVPMMILVDRVKGTLT